MSFPTTCYRPITWNSGRNSIFQDILSFFYAWKRVSMAGNHVKIVKCDHILAYIIHKDVPEKYVNGGDEIWKGRKILLKTRGGGNFATALDVRGLIIYFASAYIKCWLNTALEYMYTVEHNSFWISLYHEISWEITYHLVYTIVNTKRYRHHITLSVLIVLST